MKRILTLPVVAAIREVTSLRLQPKLSSVKSSTFQIRAAGRLFRPALQKCADALRVRRPARPGGARHRESLLTASSAGRYAVSASHAAPRQLLGRRSRFRQPLLRKESAWHELERSGTTYTADLRESVWAYVAGEADSPTSRKPWGMLIRARPSVFASGSAKRCAAP